VTKLKAIWPYFFDFLEFVYVFFFFLLGISSRKEELVPSHEWENAIPLCHSKLSE
jgi:hypothetical protein